MPDIEQTLKNYENLIVTYVEIGVALGYNAKQVRFGKVDIAKAVLELVNKQEANNKEILRLKAALRARGIDL